MQPHELVAPRIVTRILTIIALSLLINVVFSSDASPSMRPSATPAWASTVEQDIHGYHADLPVLGVVQRMRWIPPGTFDMGEGVHQHVVTITQGFWLGDSEVTQGLWQALMGNNPSGFPEDTNRPVEQVSWDDCQIFIQKLNGQVHGLRACLPTEAQWEYACRAGTARDFAGELNAMAWYKNNAANTTHPVKGKQASPWGLYDMHGNVNEWCADWYAPEYPSGLQRDPTGAEGSSGSRRVRRGGSWNDGAVFCGTVDRGRRSPGYRNSDGGFRLAALASP